MDVWLFACSAWWCPLCIVMLCGVALWHQLQCAKLRKWMKRAKTAQEKGGKTTNKFLQEYLYFALNIRPLYKLLNGDLHYIELHSSHWKPTLQIARLIERRVFVTQVFTHVTLMVDYNCRRVHFTTLGGGFCCSSKAEGNIWHWVYHYSFISMKNQLIFYIVEKRKEGGAREKGQGRRNRWRVHFTTLGGFCCGSKPSGTSDIEYITTPLFWWKNKLFRIFLGEEESRFTTLGEFCCARKATRLTLTRKGREKEEKNGEGKKKRGCIVHGLDIFFFSGTLLCEEKRAEEKGTWNKEDRERNERASEVREGGRVPTFWSKSCPKTRGESEGGFLLFGRISRQK